LKKLISKIAVAARTDFVKVSAWSAASTIVRMVSGVISTKIIAWVIGPVGIGIVGNFLNSVNIFSMLGTGGIGQGVTKYIAENYDKPEKQQKIIGHAVRIALASTLLVSLFVIIFNQFYGQYIFKTSAYNTIIWLFGASIILYSFNSLFVYIINGFKAYQKFVRLNIISSIGALVISVVLVINFGLFGALLSTIVSQSAIILITIAFVCREPWFREIFSRITIDRKVIRMLGGFTLMTVVSTFMVQFAQLSVRSYIGGAA
jgi:PST family polysaccharide transporter